MLLTEFVPCPFFSYKFQSIEDDSRKGPLIFCLKEIVSPMATRSEPVSPTSCGGQSTSSRYSWNPYGGSTNGGGNTVHQWLHQVSVRLPSAVSPPDQHVHIDGNSSFCAERSPMIPASLGGHSSARRQHPPRASGVPPLFSQHAIQQLHNSSMQRGSLRGELSDGFSQSMSDFDTLSTPRRLERDDHAHLGAADHQRLGRSVISDDEENVNGKQAEGAAMDPSQESDVLTAIGRLRKIKRDENVPSQFRRYNKTMQQRIASLVAHDETLLLDLCENDRGNIVVTIVENASSAAALAAPSPIASPTAADSPASSRRLGGSGKSSPMSPSRQAMLKGRETAADDLMRDAELLLSIVMQHCWRLCTSQGGCIALTRLFDVMPPRQRTMLEDFVVDHFLALAVHPFGNFIVQMIIQRQTNDEGVLRSFLIHVSIPSSVIAIASNKFGSHVLESFFKHASPLLCCAAMQRLLSDDSTVRFLVSDNFGNYVIQQGMRRLTQAVKPAGSRGSTPQQQANGGEATLANRLSPKTPILGTSDPCNGLGEEDLLGGVGMLPKNADMGVMREAFVAKIVPYLRESPFCHNITKSLGLRKTPTSPPVARELSGSR
ncbi:Hypothetical protein, putative [Bodo saltans]|uniref:PUM-HD domain-containing protein n=1 Tax=Bodo saltans TaxID=75058 RepID=A0A0S4JTF8_BODSA|nr:Hypothetical protein, putative [Bodo saltans]|eukprot:CUG94087.1 Hypothetical protein, putative [Bodo saltans]